MGIKGWIDEHKFDASFEGVRINGDKLKRGLVGSWEIKDCEASVEAGATLAPRLTATRVVLTGPFALLLKKDRSKAFLAITVPDDVVLVEVKAKNEGKARKFASQVNKAAAHFAQGQQGDMAELAETARNRPVTPASAVEAPTVPAGWYPTGEVQRYWDGSAWTEHTAPLMPTTQPQ